MGARPFTFFSCLHGCQRQPVIFPMAEIRTTFRNQTLFLHMGSPGTLDEALFVSAIEILNEAERDPDTLSLVLSDEGYFGSQPLPVGERSTQQRLDRWLEQFHAFLETLMTFPKPVVASLCGDLGELGLATACNCDGWVVTGHTRIRLRHIAMGRTPMGALSWHLSRMLPAPAVLRVLAGDAIEAAMLFQWGLCGRPVEQEQRMEATLRVAATYNRLPPGALQATKTLLREEEGSAYHAALLQEARLLVRSL